MSNACWKHLALAAVAAAAAASAQADTYAVHSTALTNAATVNTPLVTGDTLFLDTLVTMETGSLLQSIAFTVGAGVTSATGGAAWEVTPATDAGPRLVGVNIDVLDASNSVVFSDSFIGLTGSFAISSLAGSLGPGTYTLRATGNAVRDASLDVSLTMVPEPQTYAMLLAGLGVVAFAWRRRHG